MYVIIASFKGVFMEINDFVIKSLSTQLSSRFSNFFDINILDLSDSDYSFNTPYVGVVMLNIRGMKMFFEFDIYEDDDLFKKCCHHIQEKFDSQYSHPPKSNPTFSLLQTQIINCLMFHSGNSIEAYDYNMFKVLTYEVQYNILDLNEAINYINNQFERGGAWEPLIEGDKQITIKTSFGD